MTLYSILLIIFGIVFSSPIFPYLIFRKLIREDIIREAMEDNSKNKSENVLILIWLCTVYVVTPISISIVVFQIMEKWYFVLIAYDIFWQILYACIFLKKRMARIIVPILVTIFIVCIALTFQELVV